jgi:hypothetical protein
MLQLQGSKLHCYIPKANKCFFLGDYRFNATYMLVDENGILDLRVYSDCPVGIECNQDILLECNNLVFPCDPAEHC